MLSVDGFDVTAIQKRLGEYFWRNLVSTLILKGKEKKGSPLKPMPLVHFTPATHCSSGGVATYVDCYHCRHGRTVGPSTANQGALWKCWTRQLPPLRLSHTYDWGMCCKPDSAAVTPLMPVTELWDTQLALQVPRLARTATIGNAWAHDVVSGLAASVAPVRSAGTVCIRQTIVHVAVVVSLTYSPRGYVLALAWAPRPFRIVTRKW